MVRAVLVGDPTATERRTRRVMAEVAGYLGAVLVIAAVAVAIATQWGQLSLNTRYWTLAACIVALAAAGLGVVTVSGGRRATAVSPARFFLAAILLSAGAIVAGSSVAYWVGQETTLREQWPGVWGFGTVAVLAFACYLYLPNGLSHLLTAVALLMFVQTATIGAFESEIHNVVLTGSLILLLAVMWGVATEFGWWQDVLLGRVITAVMAFIGGQVLAVLPNLSDGTSVRWVGYLVLALVGVAGFVLYVRLQSAPYLLLGVVALTAAATEAAVDWSDGALGAAGALLVAGVVLLAASLLGLRLRRHEELDGSGDAPRHTGISRFWHHGGHGAAHAG